MFFILYVSSRIIERWHLLKGVGVRWARDKVGEGERERSVGAKDMRKGGKEKEKGVSGQGICVTGGRGEHGRRGENNGREGEGGTTGRKGKGGKVKGETHQ